MIQELTCDAQRWVWDAAFSLDSQYVVTGKYSKNSNYYKLKKIEQKLILNYTLKILILYAPICINLFKNVIQLHPMEQLDYGMLLKEQFRGNTPAIKKPLPL